MVKPEELEKLGKQIATEYLERQIPLTDGLDKVATVHGLNKNQVHRVAEAANVRTYLELMKTAQDDSYITFDVADPMQVIETVTEKKAQTNDYLEGPGKN